MPDEVDDELWNKHAGDHQRAVDDAGCDYPEAFDSVEAALKTAQTLEGVEVEEESDADQKYVLDDAPFLFADLLRR